VTASAETVEPISLVDYLEHQARVRPDAVAIVDIDGSSLTYREVDQQANCLATFLMRHGVGPGDRVGLIAPKQARVVVAMFGIMKARAAYVPADYAAPAERNRTILADGEIRAAFLDPACVPLADTLSRVSVVVALGEVPANRVAGAPPCATWDEAIADAPAATTSGRALDDLAYILYTSGSTGIPKGVMLTHRNATSFVEWCSDVFGPSADDRFSSHAPFHFDLSILDIYLPLKHGAQLHLISESLGKEPKELARFIAVRRLTVWYSTPSILNLLTEFGSLPTGDFSALRLILFAGEVFPVKQLRRLTELLPKPEYFNLYGPTETNVCTFARIPLPVPPDRELPYPIGWPCAHCRALVLDDSLHEVPQGEEGLLYIAGPSVFSGYRNRPEQNAGIFLERDGERWYNTGDVVRLHPDEGYVYLGRRDRMVKRRGYRIELGEIERAMYTHPQLAEVAVIGVPGDEGMRIVTYLVPKAGPRPSIIDLKSFAAKALLSYMSPDQFVFLEALPRTSTNKVDYQALRQLSALKQ
jgi:amino acid adenylation domain-containing protein